MEVTLPRVRIPSLPPIVYQRGSGLDGGNEEQLLAYYKSLIDFSSKDEKSNYKWVESFLKYQKKKHPTECNCSFLSTAIELHIKLFVSRRNESVDQ